MSARNELGSATTGHVHGHRKQILAPIALLSLSGLSHGVCLTHRVFDVYRRGSMHDGTRGTTQPSSMFPRMGHFLVICRRLNNDESAPNSETDRHYLFRPGPLRG